MELISGMEWSYKLETLKKSKKKKKEFEDKGDEALLLGLAADEIEIALMDEDEDDKDD